MQTTTNWDFNKNRIEVIGCLDLAVLKESITGFINYNNDYGDCVVYEWDTVDTIAKWLRTHLEERLSELDIFEIDEEGNEVSLGKGSELYILTDEVLNAKILALSQIYN